MLILAATEPRIKAVVSVVPVVDGYANMKRVHGEVRFRDLETGREMAVGLGAGPRRRYAEAARRRRDELTRAFYRARMDHAFVRTDESPVEPVLTLFARRMSQ